MHVQKFAGKLCPLNICTYEIIQSLFIENIGKVENLFVRIVKKEILGKWSERLHAVGQRPIVLIATIIQLSRGGQKTKYLSWKH
jgi:hypothetical protein